MSNVPLSLRDTVVFPAKKGFCSTIPLYYHASFTATFCRGRERKTHIEETKGSRIVSGTKEMKGTSKVIMGATLVMVVILAVVIGLILVLLAELYCSLLLRRRQLRNTNSIPTATTQTTTTIANAASPSHNTSKYPPQHPPPPPPPPFSSIYAQGVLQAPRSFLLPAVATKEDIEAAGPMKLHSLLHHQIVQIQSQEPNASPRHVGVLSSSSSPSPLAPFISKAPPKTSQEDPLQGITSGTTPCGNGDEHLVYISNPIYENDEGKASGANTPFETPGTSPSRLERGGSSEEENDEEADVLSPSYTPPLTPMKKLPAEACSVSLRDARSLDTSASDSRSINGPSSSSSGSPRTSPSW